MGWAWRAQRPAGNTSMTRPIGLGWWAFVGRPPSSQFPDKVYVSVYRSETGQVQSKKIISS